MDKGASVAGLREQIIGTSLQYPQSFLANFPSQRQTRLQVPSPRAPPSSTRERGLRCRCLDRQLYGNFAAAH